MGCKGGETYTTVSPETGYEYRVVAVKGECDSPESDSLAAETLPEFTSITIVTIVPTPEDDPIAAGQTETVALVKNLNQPIGDSVVGSDDSPSAQRFRTGPAVNPANPPETHAAGWAAPDLGAVRLWVPDEGPGGR